MEEKVSDIQPIPKSHRTLGFFDFFILWGNLAISLLVLIAGSFLIPGLSLPQAFLAILIGSVFGSSLLALIGIIGSKTNAPTMVLLRSILGIRGSYIPTIVNVIQLIGWTVFEFVIMGIAVKALLSSSIGNVSYPISLIFITAIVIIMVLTGPAKIIQKWLKKFAFWIVLIASFWLAYKLFTNFDITELLKIPGDNSMSFWSGVDLVVALPISWLPLVADYNRFARNTRSAAYGTFFGYLFSNIWFYFLGALLIMTTQITREPQGFVESIITSGGILALIVLLVNETHVAWADLYSSAVSVQNIFPKINQKKLIVILGILSFILAVFINIIQFESFLIMIGSVFVPLFAIFITDFFLIKNGIIQTSELYHSKGKYRFWKGINWVVLIIWLIGIAVYQIIIINYSFIGASLPTFLIVAILYFISNKLKNNLKLK